jgi:hypothetical protein
LFLISSGLNSLNVEGVTEVELPAKTGKGKINIVNSNKQAIERRKYFMDKLNFRAKLTYRESGRSGALLPHSPLRTVRATLEAYGSSIITVSGNVSCGGNIGVAKLNSLFRLFHLDTLELCGVGVVVHH